MKKMTQVEGADEDENGHEYVEDVCITCGEPIVEYIVAGHLYFCSLECASQNPRVQEIWKERQEQDRDEGPHWDTPGGL